MLHASIQFIKLRWRVLLFYPNFILTWFTLDFLNFFSNFQVSMLLTALYFCALNTTEIAFYALTSFILFKFYYRTLYVIESLLLVRLL
jgi:hypothetical protein